MIEDGWVNLCKRGGCGGVVRKGIGEEMWKNIYNEWSRTMEAQELRRKAGRRSLIRKNKIRTKKTIVDYTEVDSK